MATPQIQNRDLLILWTREVSIWAVSLSYTAPSRADSLRPLLMVPITQNLAAPANPIHRWLSTYLLQQHFILYITHCGQKVLKISIRKMSSGIPLQITATFPRYQWVNAYLSFLPPQWWVLSSHWAAHVTADSCCPGYNGPGGSLDTGNLVNSVKVHWLINQFSKVAL